MSESVQLPPIGGGAPPVAAATTSTSDARHVRDVQPVDLLRCQHSARIASHQGVLENTRGRGERRQRQERERTRGKEAVGMNVPRVLTLGKFVSPEDCWKVS